MQTCLKEVYQCIDWVLMGRDLCTHPWYYLQYDWRRYVPHVDMGVMKDIGGIVGDLITERQRLYSSKPLLTEESFNALRHVLVDVLTNGPC
jgi:hypothetical protein